MKSNRVPKEAVSAGLAMAAQVPAVEEPKVLDERELVIAATMVVQAVGRATPDEVLAILQENGMTCQRDALVYALERMRDRQILSETGKIEDGHRTGAYKMRRVIWASVPEIAQIKPMLPKLVESEEASVLFDEFQGIENVGDRKGRKPDITDYRMYRLDLVAITPICGGVPKDKDNNVFDRIGGDIFLKPLGFQNAIARIFRQFGLTDSKRDYVYPIGIFVKPKLPLIKVPRPVHDRRTGAGLGIKNFEALSPGETFPVWLSFPTKGVMAFEDFVRTWNMNHVHLGAYYRDSGATKVNGWEDLGAMQDPETAKKLEQDQHRLGF